MTVCRELFDGASRRRKELDAPTRVYPRCHPTAHMDVFVDSKNQTVILSCSACDRTISTIKTKWKPNANKT
jgi:hypothetical protein